MKMSGCEKCSGPEDDCCGGHDHSHSHSFETSEFGFKIFKYSMTFLAGLTLAFFAFQPSRVYKMDIDQDGVLDVVVERYFSGRKSFFKGVKEAEVLEPLNPSDGLSWEVMNLRFEAEKELLKK